MVFTKKQYENCINDPTCPLLPLTANLPPAKRPTVFECLSPKQQSVLFLPVKQSIFTLILNHPGIFSSSRRSHGFPYRCPAHKYCPKLHQCQQQQTKYLGLQRGPRYRINKRKCSEADTPPRQPRISRETPEAPAKNLRSTSRSVKHRKT